MTEKLLVAVTGASSGIGAAIARRFDRSGAELILIARDLKRLEGLAKGLGKASCHAADLFDSRQIERLFAEIPAPDVWINNAGIAKGQATLDAMPAADIDQVLNTNLLGAIRASRLAAARMRERGSGHIVNVTSTAAFNPYRGGNAYAISKVGLHMLTQCLRHDLGRTRIRVSEIAPGIVGDTDFIRRRFEGDMTSYEKDLRRRRDADLGGRRGRDALLRVSAAARERSTCWCCSPCSSTAADLCTSAWTPPAQRPELGPSQCTRRKHSEIE